MFTSRNFPPPQTEICILPFCNHLLKIKSEMDSRSKPRKGPENVSLSSFFTSRLSSQVKRGLGLWRIRNKKETSILISCLGQPVSVCRVFISWSCWMWCREDGAALISDVLLFSLFVHSSCKDMQRIMKTCRSLWNECDRKCTNIYLPV